MVLQLYLWLLFLLGLIGGAGYLGYRGVRHLLKPGEESEEKKKRRLLGSHNAHLLHARMEEVCAFCDKPTDPGIDSYEPGIGWYHGRCYKRLLNE